MGWREYSSRLQNFVFSTKILVGNRCGVAKLCLFYEFHKQKFLVSEHGTPVYVDTGSITSLQVAKSMKSSDKYSEQGRFMINFI